MYRLAADMTKVEIAGVTFSIGGGGGEEQRRLRLRYGGFVQSAPHPQEVIPLSAREDPREIDLLIRQELAIRLVGRGGLLVHAAGIVRRDEGLVFFGPSGSGKSTIAASAGEEALCDELAILQRNREGHFQLIGTPFWEGRYGSAHLGALFAIEPAEEDAIARLTAKQALRALLPQIVFPSDETAQQTLSLLGTLCSEVPAFRLRIRKGDGFWRVVDGR